MHWHDFGDLEGPGWAANAVGGAHLLYRWGRYAEHRQMQEDALRLVDHVLDDGFVRPDGFLWPYWDLHRGRFCLNYAHGVDWLCPGSLAAVGVQMLDLADALGASPRARRLREVATALAAWCAAHVPLLPSGWIPRRITLQGEPYPYTPEGRPDPIHGHSADGLLLLQLWARLGWHDLALRSGAAFVDAGGLWGSINHDTYDDHENVAYAVAFRVLRRVAVPLDRPAWQAFAYDVALPAMARYRMPEERHGVHTRSLYWMEASWDTAYLWENAEVAQAYLEAWLERGDMGHRDVALGALSAMAHHHYGRLGFLSEGIDWNNHVGQRHHIARDYYGAIRYTEPLLNNLHLLGPTLTYLGATGYHPPRTSPVKSSSAVRALSTADRHAAPKRQHLRYLLNCTPADLPGEGMARAIAALQQAGIDGLWLRADAADGDAMLGDHLAQLRMAGLGVELVLVGSDACAKPADLGIAGILARRASLSPDVLWVDDGVLDALPLVDRSAAQREMASTVRGFCPGQRIGWAGTVGPDTERLLRALGGSDRPLVAIDASCAAWHTSFLGRDVELVVHTASTSPADVALAVLAGAETVCLGGRGALGACPLPGVLAGWVPMLEQLAAARVGKVPVGIGIVPAPGAADQVTAWGGILARLGVPRGHPYGRPHLLLPEAVRDMERYGIGSALQDGAILTPGALQALLDRGWGPRIGVAGVHAVAEQLSDDPPNGKQRRSRLRLGVARVDPARGVTEELSEDPLNGRERARRVPACTFDPVASPIFAIDLLPAVTGRVLSWWVDARGERLGTAAVALELDGGGKVLILPYEAGNAVLQPARVAWLRWVGGSSLPVWTSPGESPVSVHAWVDPGDGSALLAAANPAPLPGVVGLSLPGLTGTAERLAPGGAWIPAGRPSALTLAAGGFVALRWPPGAAATHPV